MEKGFYVVPVGGSLVVIKSSSLFTLPASSHLRSTFPIAASFWYIGEVSMSRYPTSRARSRAVFISESVAYNITSHSEITIVIFRYNHHQWWSRHDTELSCVPCCLITLEFRIYWLIRIEIEPKFVSRWVKVQFASRLNYLCTLDIKLSIMIREFINYFELIINFSIDLNLRASFERHGWGP